MPPRKLSKTRSEFFRRFKAERAKNHHHTIPESDSIVDFVDKFMWPDKSVNGSKAKIIMADKSVIGSKHNSDPADKSGIQPKSYNRWIGEEIDRSEDKSGQADKSGDGAKPDK
jgi:hypothetical protein